MKRSIPVAAPALVGNEKKYVLDCLESSWISSNGLYVERFESAFAEFCGTRHALSCANGTVALHLALLALGIGPGDEVVVPTLTFVATANAVTYCGAKPVFVDSDPETWNLDPMFLDECISPRTKAIIVVHLYGYPAEMDSVIGIARKHGLFVIEDAAEAHGAEYKGKRVGGLGDIAIFSFYGNKIVTTGEGGMVVTNNAELARSVRQLKGQGMDPDRRYWFPMVGYNYRMTNIEAAIGLAQMEKVDWHLSRRREIAAEYIHCLRHIAGISMQPERAWIRNVYWMNSLVLNEKWPLSRDETTRALAESGIETRPFFYPMHTLPMYRKMAEGKQFPNADRLSLQGINLPSSALLTTSDIKYISECLARLGEPKYGTTPHDS